MNSALLRTALSAASLAPLVAAAATAPVTVTTLTETLPGAVGGVSVDALGFVYVADFGERVWKITPQGEVEVFADTLYGTSGNTVDSRGRLYQSSFNAGTVSRIDRDGTVTTVAEGLKGPVGVLVDDDGILTVCECQANRLATVSPDGEAEVFAESDLLSCPNGLTEGPDGTLYVSNFNDGRVVAVASDGRTWEHARTGTWGQGHLVWAADALWVAGFRTNRLYRVGADGEVETVAGSGQFAATDGAGEEAAFANPNGIAYDPARDVLYINDYLTPFLKRTTDPRRSVLRKVAFPGLTERLEAALSDGIEAVESSYRAYKDSRSARFTEIEVNLLGYKWLNEGHTDAAIRLFELNTEDYPKSFNAWDSLAEAYLEDGQRNEAIRYYRRSLELNPGNANARAKLEEIGAAMP